MGRRQRFELCIVDCSVYNEHGKALQDAIRELIEYGQVKYLDKLYYNCDDMDITLTKKTLVELICKEPKTLQENGKT